MLNRAIQFMPFDALKGFREALVKVEQVKENKKEFINDYFNELDNKLKQLKKGDTILIKYYYDFEYVEIIDTVKNIDLSYKKIVLKNSVIPFEDIIDFKQK